MENTRIRRPKSPALPPPSSSPSPGSLFRSKSRSSAAISLPENNSCAANTSQRSTLTTLRSKSVTKSRTMKKDEENLNPLNCKTKAGFAKFLKSSPAAATSPSAWALSPGRFLGSPLMPPPQALEPAVVEGGRGKLGGHRGGGGAVSGVLKFFRSKKAAAAVAEADELHRYRILQNRLSQWKYVNVRAETSMANVKTLAQDRIFSVWLHNSRMRNRILEKRIEVEKLRKEIKLYRIIFPQVTLLKQWAKMDKRNQETVASLAYVLSTLSLRLPLLHGAKGDIKAFQEALSMAMEVMAKLEAVITKRTAQEVEKTLYMLTERLSIVNEQEECLENLEEAVCSVTTLLVDFSGMVDDEFLEKLGLEKGTRKIVNHEERGRVLRAMDGRNYKAAAGGSLSNSLVALARLGIRPMKGPTFNVAMTGSVGSDPLGSFYRTKLRRANVDFLSPPVKDGTTGTVIVLTTPDAQRTMLAYQGTSSTVNYSPALASVISKTNVLVVEGYLFELPDTIKAIQKACEEAHRSGALVAVTASDVSCIERHFDDFWEIVGNYADIVFANHEEAGALCHFDSKESSISAVRYLSHFVPLVSVTDGHRGSYIGVKGEAVYIPPSPCVPLDTCGAGDAYASGILYGILRGVSDLKEMGTFAAKIAARVVGQQGTRLRVQDAMELADSFSSFQSDIGSSHV